MNRSWTESARERQSKELERVRGCHRRTPGSRLLVCGVVGSPRSDVDRVHSAERIVFLDDAGDGNMLIGKLCRVLADTNDVPRQVLHAACVLARKLTGTVVEEHFAPHPSVGQQRIVFIGCRRACRRVRLVRLARVIIIILQIGLRESAVIIFVFRCGERVEVVLLVSKQRSFGLASR